MGGKRLHLDPPSMQSHWQQGRLGINHNGVTEKRFVLEWRQGFPNMVALVADGCVG
jgi:hypothetical protein